MNKERLLKLADLLDTVPPEGWTFSTWARADNWSEPPIIGHRGTVACAAGWATTIPEFAAAGLTHRTPSGPQRHFTENSSSVIFSATR